jgi:hypothetical protein
MSACPKDIVVELDKPFHPVDEEHAKLSPSAGERWLVCHVAPEREAAFPDSSSDAADEGTAAHKMSEHCLIAGIDANAAPRDPKWDKWDNPEFRGFVQDYLNLVRSKLTDTSTLFVEQRLQILPEFEIWGTADAVVVDGHTLRIIDLKFGRGVLVDADDNAQLGLYGWGGFNTLSWLASEDIKFIEVTICQPRRSNTVSKTFGDEELVVWIEEQIPKARKAYRGGGEAVPGAHCKWCRARFTCRERAEYNLATAAFDFDMVPDPDCKPADPTQITEEQLVAIFKRLPMFEKWLKDVEAEVARRAHEHELPDLKWVAGKKMRYITDPVAAAGVLEVAGIEPYAERKMLGFGDLEKLAKAAGQKLNDLIGSYIGTKASKPVLVSSDDPRPPCTPESRARDDFKDELESR